MKFHLCLLPILPAIMAKPTGSISQPNDVERVEMPVDLNAAEEQYRLARAMGITVGHYAVEFHHEHGSHLRKRNTPTCSTDCGEPSIKTALHYSRSLDHLPSDFRFCSNLDTRFYNLNDCMLSFDGQDNKPVCITSGKLQCIVKGSIQSLCE